MVGDPEDFLDQHEPAAAIAFRLRVIDRDFGAVVHRHPNHLTHGYQSLSRLPRACRRAVLPSPFWRKDCRSEEHTSELQSLMRISYAVFCLNKKIEKIIKS